MDAFTGALVTRDFLRHAALPGGLVAPAAASRFKALRRQSAGLVAPSTHPRAIAALAALPLMRWLGWPSPLPDAVLHDVCTFQLVAAGTVPALLAVTPLGGIRHAHRRTAAFALGQGCRWMLLTDGSTLRLADALGGEPRGAVDVALDACVGDETALSWLVAMAGPRAFVAGGTDSLASLAAMSDAHGRRVCQALRGGVSDALALMTDAVSDAAGRSRGRPTCYAEARTAVYRVLFLLFAEARHLVPLWHPIYRRGYSLDALGARIASGASPRGTWAALQAIARLAHAGGDAGDLHVVPFNGRLFSPARAPLLDHLALDDDRVARALASMCFAAPSPHGRSRIAYADLGVEELGSVYESLIDEEPSAGASDTAGRPTHPPRTTRPSARKTTGTFYTPRPLADALVRETLAPLVDGRRPEEILTLRVLDPAMGSGAFLVSACRYLAARWEAAMVEGGGVSADDLTEADRAGVRRHIASRCLFGVDRNPMAVQLAQLSLWLATLASDRPLSFLDHHLVAGNSLVGASPLDVLARPPGRAAASRTLPLDALFEWSEALVPIRARRAAIESAPDDTASAVHGKEQSLGAMAADPELARWKAACDLWCIATARGQVPQGVYHALLDRLRGRRADSAPALDEQARMLAHAARALGCFHWPLEFPEVFLEADGRPRAEGGFDAVLGNPPWEMLRGDAAREASAREEGVATVRFARDSGIYGCQGRGHANQVQLFVERALQLARPGGRIGLVVPATLLSDDGSAPLRRALMLANGLEAVDVYDNRRAIFPIHRSVRFATIVACRLGRTFAVRCRFGLPEPVPVELPAAELGASTRLTPALLEQLTGPGLAFPDLPSDVDVRLVEHLTREHPALGAPEGWHLSFGRELNATDDRDCLRDRDTASEGLPVIEGRHLSPFRVNLAATTRVADRAKTAARLGGHARLMRPRLAYRDVASATNKTTLIAAIVPSGTVTVHTVFCLREPLPSAEQRVLCALLNSYVANYLARRRVVTHVTTGILAALPVPHVRRWSPWFAELDSAAARLERAWDPDIAADAHAIAACAYGLTPAEFDHILATFPLVPPPERAAAASRFSARMPQQSCR